MTSFVRPLGPALTAALMVVVCAAPARAQSVEQFYAGKSITMSIGFQAGGGYDIYGRLVARHMGRHIPGKPNFIVQNMPGAGSLRAAQHLAAIAPKDGSFISTFSRQMGITPLLNPKAGYDGTQLAWLGSVTNEVSTCVSWHTAQVKTWNDALTKPITFAGDGPGADPDVFALLYKNVFNAQIKLVTGYHGTTPMVLAMERGEVDGLCGYSWSTIKSKHQDWMKEKKINILIQAALQKEPDIPDVPLALDLAKTDEQRQILKVFLDQPGNGAAVRGAARHPRRPPGGAGRGLREDAEGPRIHRRNEEASPRRQSDERRDHREAAQGNLRDAQGHHREGCAGGHEVT